MSTIKLTMIALTFVAGFMIQSCADESKRSLKEGSNGSAELMSSPGSGSPSGESCLVNQIGKQSCSDLSEKECGRFSHSALVYECSGIDCIELKIGVKHLYCEMGPLGCRNKKERNNPLYDDYVKFGKWTYDEVSGMKSSQPDACTYNNYAKHYLCGTFEQPLKEDNERGFRGSCWLPIDKDENTPEL